MSDTVLIVLIIAIAIVVILFIFRRQLREFYFKANNEGIEGRLKTYQKPTPADENQPSKQYGVNISGNKQIGQRDEIQVAQKDVNVSDNLQLGQDQKIQVDPESKK